MSDPCALRALVGRPSAELLPLVDQTTGRAQACQRVVAATALAREGHGTEAVRQFSAAAEALPEVASFLELAKKRATAPPPLPIESKPPSTPDEAAQRVMRLVREAKPRRAAELALAFPRGTEMHEALEVATITALVRADRLDEAIARSATLPPSPAFQRARAWALSRAGRLEEARDAYAGLATSTTDPALRAEAAFFAAFSAYERGDLDDAERRFRASLPIVKGTSLEASARWYLALGSLLRDRFGAALPVLESLVKEHPSDREILKHRYWLGRARLKSGRPVEVKKAQRELWALATNEPLEFYGLLAQRTLGAAAPRGTIVPGDAIVRLARDDEPARTARLLWNLGLDDEARTVARGLGETEADIGVQQLIGDAHFGWRRGARFIPVPRTKGGALVNDPRWRVSFATPWRSTVDTATAHRALNPSFLYAIMRTESGFDPRAVSIAGALGAVQLLPSAARGACGLAGRPSDDARRLFEPEVAIDLGAALLARHREELGSNLLAAAAYNAGAPHAAAWMRDYGHLDVELFIERIPFKETRDYVKRVLATEAVYRALDGGPLSLDLPTSIPAPPAVPTHFPIDE